MTPERIADDEQISDDWLDAPDGDGWWWATDAGDRDVVNLVMVTGDTMKLAVSHYTFKVNGPARKWQRVKPHTPVPKPLPKSKQVTLTAKVHLNGVTVYMDGKPELTVPFPKDVATREIRARFGIEPEVQDEQ